MKKNNLTDQNTWQTYWDSHKIPKIPSKIFYKKYLPPISPDSKFIEIGGFPGLNAGYFYKNICKDVSILDFHVDTRITHEIEKENNLPPNCIKLIEADFLSPLEELQQQFDVVISIGFIEHFLDTKDIIFRHANLLTENGKLIIILPNFRGLNGFIQYIFDKKNLDIHNLACMDIPLLRQYCQELKLRNIKVQYNNKPMLWLEPKAGLGNKILRIFIKGLGYLLKLFPIPSKFLSPYIIITATK